MTPEQAQAVLDRAHEAGAFEEEPPADYNKWGDYSERRVRWRAQAANKLLGLDVWSDRFDVLYSGMQPRLRGFYQNAKGRLVPQSHDEKNSNFWIEELWNAFLRGLGAPVVDWEADTIILDV